MEDKFTRRRFIERCIKKAIGGSSAILLGNTLIAGCRSDSDSSNNKDPLDVESCDDLSSVSEAELKKRKGFGYVEKSPMPDKTCSNCNLYIPPKKGQACGGCILFDGPVCEGGYCTYWAPQET